MLTLINKKKIDNAEKETYQKLLSQENKHLQKKERYLMLIYNKKKRFKKIKHTESNESKKLGN